MNPLKHILFYLFLSFTQVYAAGDLCLSYLSRILETQEGSLKASAQLKEKYLDYSATNTEQNKKWIEYAREEKGHTFLDVENAAIKRLNDTLADKNLVTALTNFHKELFIKKIEEYLNLHPQLSVIPYSDFKSLRFAFFGERPSNFVGDLNKLTSTVAKEYERSVSELSDVEILKKESPRRWFNAGLGDTADQAGLAVRKARDLQRDYQLVSFSKLYKALVEQLEVIELKRERLVHSFYRSDKFDALFETPIDKAVLKVSVFETLRKNASLGVDQSAKAFEREFNLHLDTKDVQQLLDYFNLVDSFSPGLWIDERRLVNLDRAARGGLSADFKGMGAKNIYQAAIDLAENSHDVEQAIRALRKGEQKVTETFNQRKIAFQEEVSNALHRFGIKQESDCSGDDCVSLLENPIDLKAQKEVTQALANSQGAGALRLSFIPPNVAEMDRSILAVHGELIEKALRKNAVGQSKGQVSSDLLNQLSFAVSMPSEFARGQVHLILVKPKDLKIEHEVFERISHHFKKAVQDINQELSQDFGGPFSYSAAGVF